MRPERDPERAQRAEGLAAALKARAKEAGAQLAGIAPVDPPQDQGWTFFQDWLEKGRHGGMTYLAKDAGLREDLRRWAPKAKSVLVCGFSYAGPDGPLPLESEPQGRVARYAVLPDYHDILRNRLLEVRDWLRKEHGKDGVVFIDTSPVLEKHFARYAGVGWMGKNTLLIHPELGSYFFIAGIALDFELPADEPVPDHCGTCRRCIEACPTDAFPKDYELDASRCVAYFTIEHRGPIPEEFREGIGDWVFGCDVCQEVCPWNKFAVAPAIPEFQRPRMPPSVELRHWSKLRPDTVKPYNKTPIRHARWTGWMRNILLAMGNSGDASLIPDLEPWTQDPDPVLSEQAQASIARLRRKEAAAA